MSRRRKSGRNVNGLILLDKPSGITSNQALQIVKRLFKARKAGHTGSLDPLASGLLPICMGEATKISAFLLDADKHYWVSCKIGERTTTGDAEGQVLGQRPIDSVDADKVAQVLSGFRGPIEQIPPMYSAVKHQGQRLYKLARQGLEVERKPRAVTIHELELLRFEPPYFEIDVRCTKGTYVRTLVEDIGEVLGCGAYVADMRRLGVGPYREPDMHTLDSLETLAAEGLEVLDRQIVSIESALAQWPDVRLSGDAAFYMRQGQPVLVPHAPTSGWVRLYEGEHQFLGMGQVLDDGRVAPRRLLSQA